MPRTKLVCYALLVVLMLTMPAAAETTIRVWFADTAEPVMKVVRESLIPEFEKTHPGTRLKVEFIPWGELSPKLLTAFAGGIAPDVFMHGQAATAGFAASNQVAPLDKYIAQWDDAADFGVTLNSGEYLGKRYLVPLYGSANLLVYRTDFFQEVGLDPNSPPTDWDELASAAQRLAIKKGNRLVREGIDLSSAGTSGQQTWSTFLWQNGGNLFNKDYTKAAFNDTKGVETLEFYTSLMDGNIADHQQAEAVGSLPPLAAGTVAMQFAGTEILGGFKTYAPDKYPFVKVGVPLQKQDKAAWYSFAGLFLSQQSANKDAAWEAIQFLTSQASLEQIIKAVGGLPPRNSMQNAGFIQEDPNLAMFLRGMDAAKFNPNIPQWTKVRDILARYIERAAFGASTPKEALDAAADEVNRILQ